MATAYERWSSRSLTQEAGRPGTSSTWRAVREWDVDGATSETDALAASGIPSINDSHPLNSRLKVKALPVTRPGFKSFVVRAEYEIPADGSAHDMGESDPLDELPRMYVAPQSETEQVDRDVNGNAILNSAGDAFDSPVSREFVSIVLTITRNEPFYDVRRAMTYINKINSNQFTVNGFGSVDVGQCLCKMIAPTNEFSPNAAYVPVRYEFELRQDGFKYRLLDQGYRVNRSPLGGLVALYDAAGDRISQPALLDGDGTTISSEYKAGLSDVAQEPQSLPTGATLDPTSTADAKFLLYDKYLSADFSGLNL